jgi:hypothetical protein
MEHRCQLIYYLKDKVEDMDSPGLLGTLYRGVANGIAENLKLNLKMVRDGDTG